MQEQPRHVISQLSVIDLLGAQYPPPVKPACCELVELAEREETKKTLLNQEDHRWLDLKVIENLPVSFKKVLCEACRDSHEGDTRWSQLSKLLPLKVILYLLTILMLPIELTVSLIKR